MKLNLSTLSFGSYIDKGGGIVAANEEDYLDGLLKSLSDKENAESELKDEE